MKGKNVVTFVVITKPGTWDRWRFVGGFFVFCFCLFFEQWGASSEAPGFGDERIWAIQKWIEKQMKVRPVHIEGVMTLKEQSLNL